MCKVFRYMIYKPFLVYNKPSRKFDNQIKMNMTIVPKSASSFLHLQQLNNKPHTLFRLHSPNFVPFSLKPTFNSPMATLAVSSPTLGLSQTFSKLKKDGKVSNFMLDYNHISLFLDS